MAVRTQLTPEEEHFWKLLLIRVTADTVDSKPIGQPYLSYAFFSLIPVSAPGTGTMSVDKYWRCYIDFEKMFEIGLEEATKYLNHEPWHLLRNHFDRLNSIEGEKHALLWNYAGDLTINNDIPDLVPDYGLFPGKGSFDYLKKNCTTEEYYHKIVAKKNSNKDCLECGEPEPEKNKKEEKSQKKKDETTKPEKPEQSEQSEDDEKEETGDGNTDSPESSDQADDDTVNDDTAEENTNSNGDNQKENADSEQKPSDTNSDPEGGEGDKNASEADTDTNSEGSEEATSEGDEPSTDNQQPSDSSDPNTEQNGEETQNSDTDSNNENSGGNETSPTEENQPTGKQKDSQCGGCGNPKPEPTPQTPQCGSGAGNPNNYELPPTEGETISREETESIKRIVAEDTKKWGENNPGKLPGNAQIWAEETLKPVTPDWRTILRGSLKQIVAWRNGKMDYNRSRRNRRNQNRNIIMPALASPKVRIAVGIDVSYSNLHNMGTVIDNVVDLAKNAGVKGRDLMAFGVDVAVGKTEFVSNPAEVLKNMKGGGGTNMVVAFEVFEQLNKKGKADIAILITDLETPWPAKQYSTHNMRYIVCGILNDKRTDRGLSKTIEAAEKALEGWATLVIIPPEDI